MGVMLQIETAPVRARSISARTFSMVNWSYPKEIRTALESERWDKEGWENLFHANPDIFDIIPELKGFTT